MSDPIAQAELTAACWRSALRDGPFPSSQYVHYQGGVYTVVGMCLRESDLTPMVVYHAAGQSGVIPLFVRPLFEFQQIVRGEDGKGVARFKRLKPAKTDGATTNG